MLIAYYGLVTTLSMTPLSQVFGLLEELDQGYLETIKKHETKMLHYYHCHAQHHYHQ